MDRRLVLRDSLALLVFAAAALLPATVSAHTEPHWKPGRSSHSTNDILWGFSGMGTQFSQLNAPTQPPWDMHSVTAFESTVSGGKGVSVIGWGSPFYSDTWCGGYCGFTTLLYDTVRQSGAIPMLSWSSNQHDGAGGQPGYTDADIAAGSQDTYITQWAKAAAQWGHPFFLRFDWEMNGNWFPWNGYDDERRRRLRGDVAPRPRHLRRQRGHQRNVGLVPEHRS